MVDRPTGSIIDLLPVVAEESEYGTQLAGAITGQHGFGQTGGRVLILIDEDDGESVGDQRPEFRVAEKFDREDGNVVVV